MMSGLYRDIGVAYTLLTVSINAHEKSTLTAIEKFVLSTAGEFENGSVVLYLTISGIVSWSPVERTRPLGTAFIVRCGCREGCISSALSATSEGSSFAKHSRPIVAK